MPRLYILLLCLLLPALVFAQPNSNAVVGIDTSLVKGINAKYNNYSTRYQSEKVYLHFDKPYYAAGDTIYFKAYVTLAQGNLLSALSGVLYADLLSPDNKVVSAIKLQLRQGMAWGDFAIPDNVSQGSYRVRAYTQWMKNEGPSVFFEKHVTVASGVTGTIAEQRSTAGRLAPKPAIQFFPEGGSLVVGIPSKIAFKALGNDGLGTDVKGVVVDNEGKQVNTFASSRLGMGYFELKPEPGKTYKARVSYPGNIEDVVELPETSVKGLSMQISPSAENFNVKISANNAFYSDKKQTMYTLAILSGGRLTSYPCRLTDQSITIKLNKKEFKTGIAIATLFTSRGEPLCERLFFVDNHDQLQLNLDADKKTYTKREKVNIRLRSAYNDGKPAPAYYSVAVIDETQLHADDNLEQSILNYLLLTSDLKGYVEQPNYYFTGDMDKKAPELDLVMLTHGYRHFEWINLINDEYKLINVLPEDGLQLSGYVKTPSGKPVAKGKVTLYTSSIKGFLLDTLTDDEGRFLFDRLTYPDSTKFVIKARDAGGSDDVKITIDSALQQRVSLNRNPAEKQQNLDSLLADYAQSSKRFHAEQMRYGINRNAIMLKEVVVKDTRIKEKEASENLNGANAANQVINQSSLEDAVGYANLYEALRSRVGFVRFIDGALVSTRSTGTLDGSLQKMLIVADGTPQEDDFLTLIPVFNVAKVEIIISTAYTAIYGPRAANGVVVVTTKRKDGMPLKPASRGIITYVAGGFYKARRFYSPRYDHPKANKKIVDTRSTVYWQPDIVTGDDGTATFSYFNTDVAGSVRVVVEGMDMNGNVGRQVYRYIVE